jgi:hypothetical protein
MYEAIDGLEFREVGTETLVYDPVREKVHVVNHTAADLLRRCSGKSAADLGDYLRKTYDADGHDVEQDVTDIMNVFAEQGLVREVVA